MTDEQETAEHPRCPICGVVPLPENPHRDRELVAHLYHHHRLTQSEVSDAIDCSRTTLRNWMDKFDIDRRTGRGSRSRKLTIDSDEVPCPICESPDLPETPHRYKKILSHLYQDHFLTISEVSNELGSSEHAVRRWMNENDIETRSGGTKYKIQEDKLRNLYINKELSPNEIADQFGCSHTVVRDRLEEYGIEIRDNTGAKEITLDTDTVPCPFCDSPKVPDKPYRSPEILDHLYNHHGLTQERISDIFDVSRTTIKNWFSRLDISGTQYEYDIPKKELQELYCDEKKSIEDISEHFECSYLAVRNRLQNYDIEIRSSYEMNVEADDTSYRDREWLTAQYHDEEKSKQVIADECGVAESTIQHWMNKFDIDARSLSDAQEQRILRRDLDYMDEDLLRELYWDEEMTQREIEMSLVSHNLLFRLG